MKAAQRLFITACKSRLVAEGDPAGAFLYAAPGDEIPDSAAERFGLVDGGLARPEAAKASRGKQDKSGEDKTRKGGEDKSGQGKDAKDTPPSDGTGGGGAKDPVAAGGLTIVKEGAKG